MLILNFGSINDSLRFIFCGTMDKTLIRYHHSGIITDITKTGRQVKKILNLIFGKLFEPTGAFIEGWILGAGTSVLDFSRPSYKTACDIHLKHVFLPKYGLWRTPAPKSSQISFRLFGYLNVARTVVILNICHVRRPCMMHFCDRFYLKSLNRDYYRSLPNQNGGCTCFCAAHRNMEGD